MRLSIPVFSKTAPFGLLVLIAAHSSAVAGWGPDGATIKATTNNIPKVAAMNDGALGSIVAWQEEGSPGSGVLRAQHVLATGDVDPAWSADGALLCNVVTARAAIGLVPDRLGGAYVWWKEGAAIYLTRVNATGAVAAGWPARGRSLGTAYPTTALPGVIEDGDHGVYAGWATHTPLQTDPTSVLLVHLGPANTGAGGWPNGVRAAAGSDPVATFDYWPRLALAPDGGVFVAWASWSLDPGTIHSAYRLRRMTSAGLNAAGWSATGIELGEFHGEWLDPNPETGLVGLSDDGAGGVFALIGFLSDQGLPALGLESRLYRLQGDGAPAAGWPAGGTVVSSLGGPYADQGPDASLRVLPDGLGGAQVGQPTYYDHGTSFGFAATFPDGSWKPSSSAGGNVFGYEAIPNRSGGVFFADYYPKGPYGPYEPWAYLRVGQSLAPASWSDFSEIHFDIVVQWYGDIALASSGDGGAVFYWSQVRERFGLFARRFNPAGAVTGVEPAAAASRPALGRLRFVAGEGVRASLSLPAGASATLDLFDVTGRRVAATRLENVAGGSRDLTVPGTSALPSGLYFAKLATLHESRGGRVVVTR